MRVTVTEPNAGIWDPGVYSRHSCLEPIGAEYVAAAAEAEGHEVVVLQQRSEETGDFAARIIASDPDVLGFSTMTYNFPEALRLAAKVKLARPGLFVVIGGSHVTALPECVDGRLIDAGVIGEGEMPFVELLRSVERRTWPSDIPGVAWRKANGALHRQPRPERIQDLDSLPLPRRTGELLSGCRVNSLVWPSPEDQRAVAQVTYSRGCPYTCSFCTAPEFWGNQVTFRTVTSVLEELRTLRDEFGTNLVFFTDLTFNLNRNKLLELCDALLREDLGVSWYPMCRIDRMDKELADLMAAAGCTKVSFGIDSIRPETLRRIKAGQRMLALDSLEERLHLTWEAGILTRAYLMTGYPWETVESMGETAEVLADLPIDDLRISFLTPLPGTSTRAEMEVAGLITTDDWERYTTDEPVLRVCGASPEELLRVRSEMFRTFYNSPRYRYRMREKVARFPKYWSSYFSYVNFLAGHGIVGSELFVSLTEDREEGRRLGGAHSLREDATRPIEL